MRAERKSPENALDWGSLDLVGSVVHNLTSELQLNMILIVALLYLACALGVEAQTSNTATVAEAEAFMTDAEARLADLSVKTNQADWVHDNFITEDTEALAAAANDEITAATTELVEKAKRFDGLAMPAGLSRKFLLLKLSLPAPGPRDPALRKELTAIAASL